MVRSLEMLVKRTCWKIILKIIKILLWKLVRTCQVLRVRISIPWQLMERGNNQFGKALLQRISRFPKYVAGLGSPSRNLSCLKYRNKVLCLKCLKDENAIWKQREKEWKSKTAWASIPLNPAKELLEVKVIDQLVTKKRTGLANRSAKKMLFGIYINDSMERHPLERI